MGHFTEEQLKYLEALYGLERQPVTTRVRDGFIRRGDIIWWRCDDAPVQVDSNDMLHWTNIIEYPEAYSIEKPKVSIVYID